MVVIVSLVGCGGVDKGLFTDQQICKATISRVMGSDPSIIKVDSFQDGVSSLSYSRKDDGSYWKYRCKLEGNKAIWAASTGRWRNAKDDSLITFSVNGNELSVLEKYSDGSGSADKFTLSQLGGENSSRTSSVSASDLDKQSYALGHNMGLGLKAAQVEFDQVQFNAGLHDALEGEQRMTQEEMQVAIVALQTSVQEKQMAAQLEKSEANKAVAAKSLASSASAEGVVTTESGLQYKVLVAGEGDKPSADDVVTVHYEGRLLSGEIFDSSIQRGEPATFPLNGVIAGWIEALQLMAVGSKWQLTIPPELAYGEHGAGTMIQPNSILEFDVELLSIEEKPAAKPLADAGERK